MNRRGLLIGAAAAAACTRLESGPAQAPGFPMRRGVNLGNALEAPDEGDWGYRIEDHHLTIIADAGFDGVRLPVRWSEHASDEPPYAIEPGFFERVDHVIETALAAGLSVELDLHHYAGLIDQPQAHRGRFIALWRQIAERYRNAPSGLIYEPWNESNGDFWGHNNLSALQRDVIAAIRESDAERLIVLGSPGWNSISGLGDWRPPDAPNVAISVHYYEPHAFTHQDAPFLGSDAPHFGRSWGTDADMRLIAQEAARAAQWAAQRGYALQLGEFGANINVPARRRALWTRTVREAFEAHSVGWAVWDFAGDFRIWDRDTGLFLPEMLNALLG
jgi:endoglucanase